MNEGILNYLGIKLEKQNEYAIEYVIELLEQYQKATALDLAKFISGSGHRKSTQQRQYQEMQDCLERLKSYVRNIELCGEKRNSDSKTDHDATFMRIKRDYMENDQFLPTYNLQAVICDEYIVAVDVKPYASDMECFAPLMEKFNDIYGRYPKYPVADAGYGSYNNYFYCEEHGMEKFMRFSMLKKEMTDKNYNNDPYRAVNFQREQSGHLICPNGKRFIFKYHKPVYKNKYGRTEEIYVCETCEDCLHKPDCCKRSSGN